MPADPAFGKCMKNLIILSWLVLLSGCVSYYYPETALEDGVYYAEDDPSYVLNSGDYSTVIYYPWSSLDYFYLGYWPYPGFGYTYGYTSGWGYSPWGYPYGYGGHHSPWYFSRHHYPYWHSFRGNCARHDGCRQNDKDDRDTSDDRYAGDDQENQRIPGGEIEDNAFYSNSRKNKMGGAATQPVRRRVSTVPAGQSGNQGMVIRHRESRKTGKSRLEPVGPARSTSVNAAPAVSSEAMRPPAISTPNTYSGGDTRPPSFSAPPGHGSSMNGKSSRRKDRD